MARRGNERAAVGEHVARDAVSAELQYGRQIVALVLMNRFEEYARQAEHSENP